MQTGLATDPSGTAPGSASMPLTAAAQIEALLAMVASQSERIEALTRQLDWFKQQLFGTKSEKRHLGGNEQQLNLGEAIEAKPAEAPASLVKPHQRRRATRGTDEGTRKSRRTPASSNRCWSGGAT